MRPRCLSRSGSAALPVVLAALAALAAGAAAAAQRDPMHATPARAAALDPAASAASASAPPALPPLQARHLLVVDGRRYVVEGASRRAVGDHLGDARIESIEDGAVVVRRGGALQRLPLFAGVVKQPSREPTPAPATRSAGAANGRVAAASPSGLQGQSP